VLEVDLAADVTVDPAWKWLVLGQTVTAVDANGDPLSYHYTYYQKDDIDNYIRDNTQPAPGSSDILRGSAGSDHITSGGAMTGYSPPKAAAT